MLLPGPIPAYRVTFRGRDINDRLRGRLSSITVTEDREAEADQLDLVLLDVDGRTPLPDSGQQLTVALGYQGQPLIEKGGFIVDEASWEGPPDTVTVRARSADFTSGFRIRRDQSFRGKTLGDVLASVAQRQALQLVLADELAGRAVRLDQSKESDAALLKRLGKRFDAVATVKDGRLVFARIGAGKTVATGKDLPILTLTRQDGDRYTFTRPKREDYSGARATWWDMDAAAGDEVTVGAPGEAKQVRRTYGSAQEAAEAADGAHRRQNRAKLTFSYQLATGRPDIYPDLPINLEGFKPDVDAVPWIVAKATHTCSDQGLLTQLELQPDPKRGA